MIMTVKGGDRPSLQYSTDDARDDVKRMTAFYDLHT